MDKPAASRAYAAAVRADHHHGGAWNNLGSLVEAGHADGKGGGGSDGFPLAGVVGEGQRVEQAERCFEAATQLHPATHATAWNNLGRLRHVERRWGGAAAAYREAVRVSPTYATAWYNLGLLAQAVERSASAPPAMAPPPVPPIDASQCFREAAAQAQAQGKAELLGEAWTKLGEGELRAAMAMRGPARDQPLQAALHLLTKARELRPSDAHLSSLVAFAQSQAPRSHA